ncbi:MAG: PEGA domain-containing protein [Methanoregula sp.]|nr:PEGA domain-containing protein [Methanoregula sp.]
MVKDMEMLREMVICILAAGILLAGCVADQPLEKGTLQLTSSPSGAEIYLDNQYMGTTPGTIPGVEPGSHTLEYRMNGYSSWKSAVSVPVGTSYYFAALGALTESPVPVVTEPVITSSSPSAVTVQISREQMVVGDTIMFYGTCTNCKSVVVMVYGPGVYADGVVLDTVTTNSINAWSYTWNPGTKVQSGTFTVVAKDSAGTGIDRKEFRIIGNGDVSVIPSSYAADSGDVITFSGMCTTGARNVQLVLSGPERFSSGVDLGTASVTAQNTWSYRFTIDSTMPTGIYTISVSDVPSTGSGSSQFTVGFTS